MKLSKEIKEIIIRVQGELVHSMGLDTLDVKPSYSKNDVQILIEKISETKEDGELFLSCGEIKLLRNLVCDLLRELDTFEFSTRMGYSLDEVFDVFKRLKEEVDNVCY